MAPSRRCAPTRAWPGVERAFRCIKTVDLEVRPIYHWSGPSGCAHMFLCMLAYYVEWHMRRRLAPMLFDDHDRAAAEALARLRRRPAQPSPAAQRRPRPSIPTTACRSHSFQTLLQALSRVIKTRLRIRLPQDSEPFDKLSGLAPLQKRAFSLLGLRP